MVRAQYGISHNSMKGNPQMNKGWSLPLRLLYRPQPGRSRRVVKTNFSRSKCHTEGSKVTPLRAFKLLSQRNSWSRILSPNRKRYNSVPPHPLKEAIVKARTKRYPSTEFISHAVAIMRATIHGVRSVWAFRCSVTQNALRSGL